MFLGWWIGGGGPAYQSESGVVVWLALGYVNQEWETSLSPVYTAQLN